MLTVVLPNFNHGRFLPYAIDALLAQTRTADEILVIDDASTDGSIAVIEAYCQKSDKIRLIVNDRNQGVVANLNDGLKLATGEYVFFAAADDVVGSRLFEVGIRNLHQHPAAALFSARSDLIDTEGRFCGIMSTPIPSTEQGYITPQNAARYMIRDDGWFMGNTTIYRRGVLAAEGGFPVELGAFTDGYVSRLLALKYGACFSADVLGSWRRMEGGVAWRQSNDTAATAALIEAVERRMRTTGEFPTKYVHRWKRRHLFGAKRFVLSQRRPKSTRGRAGFLAKSLTIIEVAWLFLKLRPWDVATVLRRRAITKVLELTSGRNSSDAQMR